jgi:streptogramin lyase/signal transduction histidine kinase
LIRGLMIDPAGRVWIFGRRLLVFLPGKGADASTAALSDRARHAVRLLGAPAGAFRLPANAGEVSVLGEESGEANDFSETAVACRDGSVWVGGHHGVNRFAGGTVRTWNVANGLAERNITALLEDREGCLWMGTESRGVMRLNPHGCTTYSVRDGLATEQTAAVTLDRSGSVVVISNPPALAVSRFDGDRFRPAHLGLPPSVKDLGWGLNQVTFQDRSGEWWVPTGNGLVRYPAVAGAEELALTAPRALYAKAQGMESENLFRLFEDSRGDLWIGTFGHAGLVRWERANGEFHPLGPAAGVPRDTATAFAEVPSGTVWVGFFKGGLARIRGARIDYFRPEDGVPCCFVNALLVDHRGRLWLGSSRDGLGRLDDPRAGRPQWRRYTTADGLASNAVQALTEDRWGRLYLGGPSGVDRLDPSSGRIEHLDTTSGLANNMVVSATTDGAGDVWFATWHGVSRLTPEPERHQPPPRVVFNEIRVEGETVRLPEMGSASVSGLRLPASVGHVEVRFTGIDLAPAERLAYRYAINGGMWSAPSRGHRVDLAGLTSGAYDIRVIAARSDGIESPPARVSFTIAAPFWRRWWFVLSMVAALAVAIGAGYRARVGRLLAMQRMRTRIGADLHDEMGLSLTRISVLSALARRNLPEDGESVGVRLDEIGESARDLMDATADMVWALDARRDDLTSLLARLRRHAADVLAERGIALTFSGPEQGEGSLAAEQRRNIFLIFKEAIHNCARHSGARCARLTATVSDGWLHAELSDDGHGFAAGQSGTEQAEQGGRGLGSMVKRARELGGRLAVESVPGQGTAVRLSAPLQRRRWWRRRMNMLWR